MFVEGDQERFSAEGKGNAVTLEQLTTELELKYIRNISSRHSTSTDGLSAIADLAPPLRAT